MQCTHISKYSVKGKISHRCELQARICGLCMRHFGTKRQEDELKTKEEMEDEG